MVLNVFICLLPKSNEGAVKQICVCISADIVHAHSLLFVCVCMCVHIWSKATILASRSNNFSADDITAKLF